MEQSNFSKHTNTNWRFRREQAQADINRFVGYLKHYEDVKCQIRFLNRCVRSRMIPKGLRSSLASMQHSSKSGFRFCKRIQLKKLWRKSGINMNYCQRLITKFEDDISSACTNYRWELIQMAFTSQPYQQALVQLDNLNASCKS